MTMSRYKKIIILPICLLVFSLVTGIAQADITGTISSNGYGAGDYCWSVTGTAPFNGCGDTSGNIPDGCYSAAIDWVNPALQVLGTSGGNPQCASGGAGVSWGITLGPVGGGGGGGNPPPTGSFEISVNDGPWQGGDVIVPVGSFVDVKWSTNNASSCVLMPVNWSETSSAGNQNFGPFDTPDNYLVQLICDGSGGNGVVVDSATATVTAPATSVDLTISWAGGSVTANKGDTESMDVPYGTNVTVSWDSTGMTACTLTEDGNPVGAGISNPGVNYLVTRPVIGALSCTGPNNASGVARIEIGSRGTITINMTQSQGWNFTSTPPNYAGPLSGVGPAVIPDAPFGVYTLSAANIPGYTVSITPCNPQNLNQTAAACD
jgi:hypothetical protein